MVLYIKSDPKRCAGQWLASLFSQVSSPLGLEDVSVTVRLDSEDPSYWAPWADLDAILSKPVFNKLREYCIKVELVSPGFYLSSPPQEKYEAKIASELFLLLPNLTQQCVFKFQVGVNPIIRLVRG